MEQFQTGVQMAQMPGVNPTGDAINSVVDAYNKNVELGKEMAFQAELHKKKTKAEYGVKKEHLTGVLDDFQVEGGSGNRYLDVTGSGDLSIKRKFTPAQIEAIKGGIAAGGYIDPSGYKEEFGIGQQARIEAENYIMRKLGPDWRGIDADLANLFDAKYPEVQEEVTPEPVVEKKGGINIREIVDKVKGAFQKKPIPEENLVVGRVYKNAEGVSKRYKGNGEWEDI